MYICVHKCSRSFPLQSARLHFQSFHHPTPHFPQAATSSSESLSSAAADFYLMSSPARSDIDALPYAQRLQAVLHGHLLPHKINLGHYNYTDAGHYDSQEDFKAMTAGEVQLLAHRLQAQPHVTHLNLSGHKFGPESVRLLIGPILMQTGLQTLNLAST